MTSIKKFDSTATAKIAVKTALAEGVSVQTLKAQGVKLLMKDLKADGILPKGMTAAQMRDMQMALALAIEQLAANTQFSQPDGGVTA